MNLKPSYNSLSSQVLYFSHGGGPLPLMQDPSHEAMNTFMKDLTQKINRPDMIIVFSAHWEGDKVLIQGNEKPGLLYDYYGFPEETYQYQYSTVNSPTMVTDIAKLLDHEGIPYTIDHQRDYDHGVFVPLMLMYPKADIPCLQISLLHSLDPQEHIRLGEALQPLLQKNILFIGSGFSFHNMSAFRFSTSKKEDALNDAFQEWLKESLCSELSDEEQRERLLHWEKAPNARYCHPREEHLLPLHICFGLAHRQAACIFDDAIAGKRALAFFWPADALKEDAHE